jgi:DNA mismatch repair protein MutS
LLSRFVVPDALLLFRCGDFYECYEEDAIAAVAVLALKSVHHPDENNVTMAGFPHHALDTYLPRLIRAGHRVAICDDITDFGKPKASRKRTKKADTIQPTEIVEPSQQELFTQA